MQKLDRLQKLNCNAVVSETSASFLAQMLGFPSVAWWIEVRVLGVQTPTCTNHWIQAAPKEDAAMSSEAFFRQRRFLGRDPLGKENLGLGLGIYYEKKLHLYLYRSDISHIIEWYSVPLLLKAASCFATKNYKITFRSALAFDLDYF